LAGPRLRARSARARVDHGVAAAASGRRGTELGRGLTRGPTLREPRFRPADPEGGVESYCGDARCCRSSRCVMRESEVTEGAATDPEVAGRPRASSMAPTWLEYLRPLRFDHWIKNLVVPV